VRAIDLNCDLGEGAGADAELMPLVSSANIACGAHAGDEATMRETVRLALRHRVAIGAHPGFADPEHFGRRELPVSPREAGILVAEQVRRLQEIAHALGGVVHHVKLHGALYNQVSRDRALAEAVVGALRGTARAPLLYVLSGSVLETVARTHRDVAVACEVFADRTYQRDGSLTPRTRPEALIADEEAAVAQVLRLVRDGRVRATDGTDVPVRADTVCLHGDGPHAVPFARRLRSGLAAADVAVRAPAGPT
jgi:UPF0271 protein